MNKSQITAINEVMMKRLYAHYQKLNNDDVNTDPAITKLVEKSKELVAEAKALNATLAKKYKGVAYNHISNVGPSYGDFKTFEVRDTNSVSVRFSSEGHLYFKDHDLAKKANKDIVKVEDYILRLTLGTSTVDEMDNLLATLTK